ncbi:hypothetical protein BDN67DRAFT_909914 [Paxillus ammoniavirescens]|nr:hypothetical protein BDN67DRAFT_909914 [Paxillus ammoniavirescens]
MTNKLRLIIGAEWNNFVRDFWAAYRAVSPEEFDRLWDALVTRYPSGRQYLNDELHSCRQKWTWAWTSHTFTAGIRTNGRVEVENQTNKMLGGPKKSLLELFNNLNECTNGQSAQEMIRARELLRAYVGPFALQTCFKEMEKSVFYDTHVVHLPDGVRTWNGWNNFDNDHTFISTRWLLWQISSRGLQVQHLLKIIHKGTNMTHYLVLLPGNSYVCDCCMGMNLGIPCRHYFQALVSSPNLVFRLGLVHAQCVIYHDGHTCRRLMHSQLVSEPFDRHHHSARYKTRQRNSEPAALQHHDVAFHNFV